jgi:hypothetical protein
MRLLAEVIGKYDHPADASKLLYAPLGEALTYRETRRYTVDYTGDTAACETFLTKVLSNSTSHELRLGEAPALTGASFHLDYGMKPGALDLEKETILAYFRGLENPGFELTSLKIQRRVYLYGATPASAQPLSERFVKDIVNPAVHHYDVKI